MFFSLYMYMCGIVSFSLFRKHLLSLLLSLELIVLSLYMMILFYLYFYSYEVFFSLIFLTFSVCEGSLGLGILVSMIRFYGSDQFRVFSVLW
uniref:NADH-ubiquinone oxidoreductase chain 4L n=1 Tax=Dinoderus minutus TaxID=1587246 RepID=A0A343C1C1_9COLE|nr:NADH dehydrogenase subunit 4L [Dinoderus minutus]